MIFGVWWASPGAVHCFGCWLFNSTIERDEEGGRGWSLTLLGFTVTLELAP